MAEKMFPVVPTGLAYLCDNCNKGLAVATDKTSPDGLIRHTCANCGFNYFFKKRYPTIEWRFPSLDEVQKDLVAKETDTLAATPLKVVPDVKES